nr:nitrogen fixation protein NifZ [Rhodovibrio salinarum]
MDAPPRFVLGSKVRARAAVRNDGSVPHVPVGDLLVEPGDLGYVRDIGSFLQRFRIYEIDFIRSGRIIGMRAGELEPAD